jgi:exodeoxyribonuclease III
VAYLNKNSFTYQLAQSQLHNQVFVGEFMALLTIWSWNVNGLRAAVKKGFVEALDKEQPDIIGIQETKLQEGQIPPEIAMHRDYHAYWSHAERKGYSGTLILSKIEPRQVMNVMDIPELDGEGRIVAADYGNFILYNVYFPNGQQNDERLQYKLRFYDTFLQHIKKLRDEGRNVIVCGDYNTAHHPIDLAHPKENENYSGFMLIERERLDTLESYGFVDTFRAFDKSPNQYTWWTVRVNARERNVGWRIDYFFVNKEFMPQVKKAYIRQDIMGSDHCPVGLEIEI